jgi:hypothetical protein
MRVCVRLNIRAHVFAFMFVCTRVRVDMRVLVCRLEKRNKAEQAQQLEKTSLWHSFVRAVKSQCLCTRREPLHETKLESGLVQTGESS